jgi:hypothetical protein
VVQTVFLDALAAPPQRRGQEELRRWLLGIARHKVADRHRRALREPPVELPDIPSGPPPIEAREMVRWAERQAGDEREAKKTLAWMAREGEGEKLEAIAADEKLPATQVRQRVSRMRRWMKERWAAELAAVAMLALLALAAWYLLRKPEAPVTHDHPELAPTILPEPPSPQDRGRSLRAEALRACDQRDFRACLDGLDQARALDPVGDQDPAVGAARAAAEEALAPPNPSPTSAPSAAPFPDAKQGPSTEKAAPLSTAPAPSTAPPSPKKAAPKPAVKGKPSPSDPSDPGTFPGLGTGTGTGKSSMGGSKVPGVKKRSGAKDLPSD